MDNPQKTFEFINEDIESRVNNGYRPFETVNEARENIRKQLAYIFGNLLRQKFDPVKSGTQDIISEIKTLRHELSNDATVTKNYEYLRTTRLLIIDKNAILGNPLREIADNDMDTGIIVYKTPIVLKALFINLSTLL